MHRILVAASIFAAATIGAETNTMSGQWKLESDIQGHQSELNCTLTQTGKDFVGTCKSNQGAELKLAGKVEDKKVTFQYKTEYEGQELTVIHNGTFQSASKLAGTVDVQPLGVSGDFTATQSK